jgi:hypothetical protein
VQWAPGIPHALFGAKDTWTTRAQRAAGMCGRVFTQHRRPCERRDPYAVSHVLKDAVRRLSRSNEGLWLWVPAFAGTTVKWLFDN